MASTKVILRTAYRDEFIVGTGKDEIRITQEGTELPSKAKADEVIEAARRSGVTLYQVENDDAVVSAETKNERTGS